MHTASGMGIVCLRSAVCHVWEGWLLLRSCPCTSAVPGECLLAIACRADIQPQSRPAWSGHS